MSLASKVKVRVHTAYFIKDDGQVPYFFINVRNCFKRRNITITNVYCMLPGIVSAGKVKEIINLSRPLPETVKPNTEWETFIVVSKLDVEMLREVDVYNCFVIMLASDRTIISKRRKGVPSSGIVPGGE
jgi:hypothetical protein